MIKMVKKCRKLTGDVFDNRKSAEKFRKDLVKQGFSKVPKVKKIKGCVPYTKIPKNYWKV